MDGHVLYCIDYTSSKHDKNFTKDEINHDTLYPCSTSIPEITSDCWSFARNETTDETCIVQVEPCDDVSDQSEDEDEMSTNCVKIIDDDLDLKDLKFHDGTPIICRDQISAFFIGLSEGDLTQGFTDAQTARLQLFVGRISTKLPLLLTKETLKES